MDRNSYAQYASERENWLKRGRRKLLGDLIMTARGNAHALSILEVGAGVGQNISMLRQFGTVEVVESDPCGLDALKKTEGIHEIHAAQIPFELGKRYDVICAMDVLEHIENDAGAASWMANHLLPGGLLVVTVPAYGFLFGAHDRALGHHRRYNRRMLLDALPASLRILSAGYFNSTLFPLAAGLRLVHGFKHRKGQISDAKQKSQVPYLVDRVLGKILSLEADAIARGMSPWFGLSVYCVASK